MKQVALVFLSLWMPFLLSNAIGQSPGAQSLDQEERRYRIGFMAGYGDQTYLSHTYRYKVTLFQLQYYYALWEKEKWALELLIQPQYNRTRYRRRDIDQVVKRFSGYELGCNVGLLLKRKLFKDILAVYMALSSGPHYVSGTPRRQAAGFLFSDNLMVGLSLQVYKSLYLDIRPTYRHISNCGLKKPNLGINSLLINGGFYLKM